MIPNKLANIWLIALALSTSLSVPASAGEKCSRTVRPESNQSEVRISNQRRSINPIDLFTDVSSETEMTEALSQLIDWSHKTPRRSLRYSRFMKLTKAIHSKRSFFTAENSYLGILFLHKYIRTFKTSHFLPLELLNAIEPQIANLEIRQLIQVLGMFKSYKINIWQSFQEQVNQRILDFDFSGDPVPIIRLFSAYSRAGRGAINIEEMSIFFSLIKEELDGKFAINLAKAPTESLVKLLMASARFKIILPNITRAILIRELKSRFDELTGVQMRTLLKASARLGIPMSAYYQGDKPHPLILEYMNSLSGFKQVDMLWSLVYMRADHFLNYITKLKISNNKSFRSNKNQLKQITNYIQYILKQEIPNVIKPFVDLDYVFWNENDATQLEVLLAKQLTANGEEFQREYIIPETGYSVDFFAIRDGKKVIIEADGAYHYFYHLEDGVMRLGIKDLMADAIHKSLGYTVERHGFEEFKQYRY